MADWSHENPVGKKLRRMEVMLSHKTEMIYKKNKNKNNVISEIKRENGWIGEGGR